MPGITFARHTQPLKKSKATRAYTSTYYPIEFMTAVINNFGGFYRTEVYVHVARMSTAPRIVSWYGDTNRPEHKSNPNWPKELVAIKERVEKEAHINFNAVLLNLYRNGKDGVGWHSDKRTSTNKDMNIASVTFGETRLFRLRHKILGHIPQIEIPLHHSSFLLMAGTTNSFWEHQVPKTAKEILPRINLTFRQVNRK